MKRLFSVKNMLIGLIVLPVLLVIVAFGVIFFLPSSENGEVKETGQKQTQAKNEKFEFFPVRFEDFVIPPKMYGLWPYGVKGEDKGSHNEGHPGWDFELKKGSKLYAISDLRIQQIHEGDKQTESGKVQVIEANAELDGQNIHITYHSVINLLVKEGQEVNVGEPIAEVGYPLSESSAMIHFGIFAPNDSVGSCPEDFFADALKPLIERIVANSIDMKTGKSYESACVGKVNKEIYYQNFPDRVQYLRGAEPWE